jgi:hypothetical protein
VKRLVPLLFLLPLPVAGCMTHAVRVEPITLEPVRVTMDVNLHVDDTRPVPEPRAAAEAPRAEPSTAAPTTGGETATPR